MRRIDINRDWRFKKSFEEADVYKEIQQNQCIQVSLPHTHEELPYNSFDEKVYQFVSCYQKSFNYNDLDRKKRLWLHFEGVMTYAKVYVNGYFMGEHKGGYTPFKFDITEVLQEENLISVLVDGTEREDIPPFGFVIDYLTYAGIYREVYLEEVGLIALSSCKIQTQKELEVNKGISGQLEFTSHLDESKACQLSVNISDALTHQVVHEFNTEVIIQSGRTIQNLSVDEISQIALWSVENPQLYLVVIHLIEEDNEIIAAYQTRIGFRVIEFRTDGFYLNKERCLIRGLNRHQSFPYVGYAMAKRGQVYDADILKFQLGLNLVRTSHYPQSSYFLDRCDEIGLLVFEEIPGWQHIGDEAWQAVAVKNVEEMINRDYHHPSIILWGVRINESGDHHDFYTKTNQLAHELDPKRPTGGSRCITHSELLEDVYTFNDFVLGDPFDPDQRTLRPQQEITGMDNLVPYMVTEYNGHLYPTKRFDQIERQEEHVRRHLQVLSETALTLHTAGSIGWCAFDYNTHYQFGSGDRICYHGVMDMFRIPKMAAYVYASQISPKERLVLEPVMVYAMGEKSYGGITPLTILTNVDYIDYLIDGKKFGRYYKAVQKYPGLSQPPIIIEGVKDVWGSGFHDIELIGYLENQPVISRAYARNPIFTDLKVEADYSQLVSHEADTTRVVIWAVDQKDQVITYVDLVVSISVKGCGTLIGPSTVSLIGGCRAFWVKTNYESGVIEVQVEALERGIIKNIRIDVV